MSSLSKMSRSEHRRTQILRYGVFSTSVKNCSMVMVFGLVGLFLVRMIDEHPEQFLTLRRKKTSAENSI